MIRIRLQEIAEEHSLTLKQLIENAGITAPTVRKWWIGLDIARIESDVLEKLCVFLECAPGDLIVMESDKPKRRKK